MAKEKKRTSGYSVKEAARYWSQRLQSREPLSAVLTYNAPLLLNQAYDQWERHALQALLPSGMMKKKALDIGCGIGRIALLLAENGAQVTAIDISHAMLATCRKNAQKKHVDNRIQLVQVSAHQFAFKEKFDIVTCFGLLEHLPSRQRTACLDRALKVLKAKGRLLVVVNNKNCIFLNNHFSTTTQKSNGYYVSLVGLEWLKRFCRKRNIKITVKAANPFYAFLHYYILPFVADCSISEQEFALVCRQTAKLDLHCNPEELNTRRLASHFIVEIRK